METAKEFLKNSETYDKEYPTISLYDAERSMVEFAQKHAQDIIDKIKFTLTSQYIEWKETDYKLACRMIDELKLLDNIK